MISVNYVRVLHNTIVNFILDWILKNTSFVKMVELLIWLLECLGIYWHFNVSSTIHVWNRNIIMYRLKVMCPYIYILPIVVTERIFLLLLDLFKLNCTFLFGFWPTLSQHIYSSGYFVEILYMTWLLEDFWAENWHNHIIAEWPTNLAFFIYTTILKKRKWHCEVRNTIIMKTDMMIVQIPKY